MKSKQSQLLKYLFVFPLLIFSLICCTQSSYSGNISNKDSSILFRGNNIQFEEFQIVPYAYLETYMQQQKMFMNIKLEDSILIKDLTTGLVEMHKVETSHMPSKLNGLPILGNENTVVQHSNFERNYTVPVFIGSEKDLTSLLFLKMKNELNSLDNGEYYFRVNHMVVDAKGNIAYYENVGIESYTPPGEKVPVNLPEVVKLVEQKMMDVLNINGLFKPAIKDGKPVNVRYYLSNYILKIKDHKAQLLAGGGC